MADTQTICGNRRVVQRSKVRKDGWTKKRREAFLVALAETCNVTLAANCVGMSKRSVYLLRTKDAAFAGLWQEALTTGYERLEEALLHRALVGVNAIDLSALLDGEGDRDVGQGATDASEHPEPARDLSPRVGSGIDATKLSATEVQLALALLNRHRATVESRRAPTKGRQATQEETDAALTKKLDALARKLGDDS